MGELRVWRDRGQSEVLGVALLLTIVVGVSLTVVVAGSAAIEQSKSTASVESATMSMTKLDSQIDGVETGDTTNTSGELPGFEGGDVSVEESEGQMEITVEDDAGNELASETIQLGRVVYEVDGQQVAYQGGGVWRKHDGSRGSVMVSPPNFDYRNGKGEPTLTIPVVQVTGTATDSEFTINSSGAADEVLPTGAVTNPLRDGQSVQITIRSEFYRAWGRLFAKQTDATPSYDHGANEVSITMSTPIDPPAVVGPIVADGPSEISIQNQMMADSYDSRDGEYSDQDNGTTTVYANSNVTVKGGTKIYGNLQTTGSVTLKGQSNVSGTVYHDGEWDDQSGADWGSNASHTTRMPTVENRSDWIENRVSSIQTSKDHSGEHNDIYRLKNENCGTISNNPCTLGEGRYYIDEINLGKNGNDGHVLRLEPDGGEIHIAVPNGIVTKKNSLITVVGSGTVHIYNMEDATFGQNSDVSNPGDNAHQFWLWQHSTTTTNFKSKSNYTGVVHAGPDGKIKMHSNNKGHIFGSVVGNLTQTGASRPIHYDRALQSEDPFETSDDRVTYLHVSRREIEIRD